MAKSLANILSKGNDTRSVSDDDSEYDENYADIGPFPPVPKIGIYGRDQRPCVKHNYIPHLTPSNNDRGKWHYAYIRELVTMYNIVADTMEKRYPHKKFRWNDNTKFNNFSRLIYHCSSKYISPYLENESKDSDSE